MNQIALIALIAWPLVALIFFITLGAWRGVIASYIGAYVLLTGKVLIPMAGLPDFTKYTAANLAALAGILIFDTRRLAAFRPRWYDLVPLTLCAAVATSFSTNGIEPWQGVTAVSNVVLTWCIPYFVGRLYAGLPGADRDLAMGLTMTGALSAPLIAFEAIAEQSLSGLIYGLPSFNGHKFGFYRAVLMATNGLELGLWSTMAALAAFTLWANRSVEKLAGLPIGYWTLAAIAGAVLCFETAALGFLLLGMFLIGMTAGRSRCGPLPEWIAAGAVIAISPKLGIKLSLIALAAIGAARYLRDRRPRLLIAIVVLIVPIYIAIRITNAVSRYTLTFIAYMMLGPERGRSLDFRIVMEAQMVDHLIAMSKLAFGWATFAGGRGRVSRYTIVDSMWIIQLTLYGLFGLIALYGMLCLPMLLATRRRPVETWGDPRNGPAVALSVCVLTYTFDSLLNAYNIVVVPMIIGVVMSLPALVGAARSRFEEATADRQLERVDRLVALGRMDEAEAACRRLIAVRSAGPSGSHHLADVHDRLADLLEALGRPAEAESIRRRALDQRVALAASAPGDPGRRAALAGCGERLARHLAALHRYPEALDAREMALEQRAALAATFPDDPITLRAYADGLNDLAWLISVGGDGALGDPARAVAMAEQAVRIRPDCKAYWNTLGASYLRAGDHASTLAAVHQSLRLGPDDSGFDEVLRALALAALGDVDGARESLGRVDSLMRWGRPAPASLLALRTQASEALGIPATASPR